MIEYVENHDAAIFDGLLFRRDKHTGYYLNKKTQTRLHVYVWEYHNGKVPKGYHIHHIDFDKDNNEIDNLQLLTASAHLKLHGENWDEERKEKQVQILKDKAVPASKEWHASEKGHDWHKKHYEQTKDKLHKKQMFKCVECGCDFEAEITGANKFCSNRCKSAFRRRVGIDNETRTCECCGGEYVANKYSTKKFCSASCRNKMRVSTKN